MSMDQEQLNAVLTAVLRENREQTTKAISEVIAASNATQLNALNVALAAERSHSHSIVTDISRMRGTSGRALP